MDTKRITKISIVAVVLVMVVGAAYAAYRNMGKSSDMRSTLVTPTASSTQEERGQYVSLIANTAVLTDTIEISSCLPNPVASSMAKGSELTIVNKDAVSHAISFNPDHSFVVGTSSSVTVKADFGKTAGVFPFQCDSSTSTVGVVLIKP